MALQSQLFHDDPKLEAAANVDSAHITPSARGTHVEKIQTALNILDNAGLRVDGAYGPTTANAVLSYKTKRNIVNHSYQTSADNVVGKMTMTKLDEEMRAYETKPPARIELIPISPRANRDKAYPRINFQFTASKAHVSVPTAHVLPAEAVTIDLGQTAEIEVKNGSGYHLTISESQFINTPSAVLIVPGFDDPVTHCVVNVDSIRIKVRGIKWGSPILFAQNFKAGPEFTEKLVINVRDPRPTIYTRTNAHHHEPVKEPGEWNKVCEAAEKDPELGVTLTQLAKQKASPPTIVAVGRLSLGLKRMARWHFEHYLSGGGAVVNEDDNIKMWIKGDSNARTVISRRIREKRRNNESSVRVTFEFNQLMFDDSDAQFSFGTIDQLDVAADFVMGTVKIWFEDTYEWHPPYKPYSCPEKVKRDTHFGHAALVQMKTRGARDFQMRGEATLPMNLFPGL